MVFQPPGYRRVIEGGCGVCVVGVCAGPCREGRLAGNPSWEEIVCGSGNFHHVFNIVLCRWVLARRCVGRCGWGALRRPRCIKVGCGGRVPRVFVAAACLAAVPLRCSPAAPRLGGNWRRIAQKTLLCGVCAVLVRLVSTAARRGVLLRGTAAKHDNWGPGCCDARFG